MNVFSYVITHDSGFAPNPFGGFLTLATCKPQIRKYACIGDFVIGTGSTKTVGTHKLVYAAQVAKKISIDDYGRLPQYDVKRPSRRGEPWQRHGDNIYFQVDGEWRRRASIDHSPEDMDHDLRGKYVLICNRFWYFGDAAIDIPREFESVIKRGPNCKRIKDASLVTRFVAWLNSLPAGCRGTPEMDPSLPKRCTGGGSVL